MSIFDSKDIQAYKSIKAPEALKSKIYATGDLEKAPSMQKKTSILTNRRLTKTLSAIAACLCFAVLAGTALGLLNGGQVAVSYFGAPLTEAGTQIQTNMAAPAAQDMRQASGVVIPITVEADSEATVTVSNGEIYTADENGEIGESLGKTAKIDSQTSLCWVVDQGATACELTVKQGLRAYTYVYESGADGVGTLYRK